MAMEPGTIEVYRNRNLEENRISAALSRYMARRFDQNSPPMDNFPGLGIQAAVRLAKSTASKCGPREIHSKQLIVYSNMRYGDIPMTWEGYLKRDIEVKQQIQKHVKFSIFKLRNNYEVIKNAENCAVALHSVYAMKLQWHEDIVKYIELLQEEAKSSGHCEWIAEQVKCCESVLAENE